jgi:hypothetical protein
MLHAVALDPPSRNLINPMDDLRDWSIRRSSRIILAVHLPLSLLGPTLITLTWRNHAAGRELFCTQTPAEAFVLSALFWTPVTLVVGVALSMTLNFLMHRRVRFTAWSEVGLACLVTHTVVVAFFVLLLTNPFHVFGQDNVAVAGDAVGKALAAARA